MKNRITLAIGSLFIVLSVAVAARHLIAQDVGRTSGPLGYQGFSLGAGAGDASGGFFGNAAPIDPRNPSLSQVRRSLDVLKASFKRAKGAEEQTTATSAIRSYLVEYFDRDMQARQAELAAVKRRVEELEELLGKRVKAKDVIIDSQLDTTIREAEGLGFFRADGVPLSSLPEGTQLILDPTELGIQRNNP